MRLEFRILWFENQPDDVKTTIEDIGEYIAEAGFCPMIQMELSSENIDDLGEYQKNFDEFDLVVVDYDLGNPGKNGDWVAQKIRRQFGFTDIIFYSAKKPNDLRKLVCESEIDGVYCFNRTSLSDKLALHIDQVVHRISRLEAMRGLSMAVVGKCDDAIKATLKAFHAAGDLAKQGEMNAALDRLVEISRESSAKNYLKQKKFSEKLNSRSVSSFTLAKLLQIFVRSNSLYKDQYDLFTRYEEEVLKPRNVLGHATEEKTDAGWTIKLEDLEDITVENFKQLRISMATHWKNIDAIRSLST